MGKTSRVKGASYERELARAFRELGWTEAKRHLEYQGEEAEMGRDLDGTQPFAVQAKCWKSTPSISAIEQVVPDEEYPIPIAILKRTQSKGKTGIEGVFIPLEWFEWMLCYVRDLDADQCSGNGCCGYADDEPVSASQAWKDFADWVKWQKDLIAKADDNA